jgi:Fur family transcriptional regulator, ferric uptake regulator
VGYIGCSVVDNERVETLVGELRAAGCRVTPQRRAVLEEVVAQEGHISPVQLAERVSGKLPGVNPATVYRTLWLLDQLNILSHTHLEDGVSYHHADRADHVHLTCSNCGRKEVLGAEDVASMARLMQRHHGFAPDFTHFAIAGLCRDCRDL